MYLRNHKFVPKFVRNFVRCGHPCKLRRSSHEPLAAWRTACWWIVSCGSATSRGSSLYYSLRFIRPDKSLHISIRGDGSDGGPVRGHFLTSFFRNPAERQTGGVGTPKVMTTAKSIGSCVLTSEKLSWIFMFWKQIDNNWFNQIYSNFLNHLVAQLQP